MTFFTTNIKVSIVVVVHCWNQFVVVVVLFIVLFNMTVVENVFNNKFGYSTCIWRLSDDMMLY